MDKNWPKLTKPPVVIAIFQIKFKTEGVKDLSFFIRNRDSILKRFPNFEQRTHTNINLPGNKQLGSHKLDANTKIANYTFSSENKDTKLSIEADNIAYTREGEYYGWETFIANINESLQLLSNEIKDLLIKRTSIRFINKFDFKHFDDPLEYFNTTISIKEDIDLGGNVNTFNYMIGQIYDKLNIRSRINHALQPTVDEKFEYFFDIDVLDDNSFPFSIQEVSKKLEELRAIKNNIFFQTVNDKTLEQCY